MFFTAGLRALLDGWRSGKFVSWHTAQPSSSGSNEYTSNGAARLPLTLTTSTSASAGMATTSAAIESAAATGAWSRISHVGIVSARNGGTFHAWIQLGSAVMVGAGEKIRIPSGDLDISIPVS